MPRVPAFDYSVSGEELDAAPSSGDALLLWLARRQWPTIAGGMLFGSLWMVAIALQPAAIGRAIDRGIVARDPQGLLLWSLVIAGLGVAIGLLATARHVFAVRNWLHAAFRSALVADHATRRGGPAVTRTIPAGEVLTSFTTDFGRMGATFDVSARFSGALVSFVVVATILLRTSVPLGLVLLVGGPVLISTLGLVMRSLSRRQEAVRAEVGQMTTIGADTVAGLRVLRGVGGEEEFLRRYAAQSGRVRAAGIRLAPVQALLEGAQVLLPGVFVLVVVGAGAHLAVQGRITPGQLVAFFGYTAFLTIPLRTAVEFAEKLASTRVAAGRIARIVAVGPDHADGPAAGGAPPLRADVPLHDPASKVLVEAGRFTALVSARPEDSAAVLARLGRTVPGRHGVCWGDQPVDDVPVSAVRARALVAEAHPALFSAPLRTELGVAVDGSEDDELLHALHVASAEDVIDALPDGLDSEIEEHGKSLSGGQRQRMALARALLSGRDILLLVEPTSAVDTHTEARIAERLVADRAGRTTVVTSASPLVLAAADRVVLLEEGTVSAVGTHADLLAGHAAYRSVVTRGEES